MVCRNVGPYTKDHEFIKVKVNVVVHCTDPEQTEMITTNGNFRTVVYFTEHKLTSTSASVTMHMLTHIHIRTHTLYTLVQ